MRGCLHICSPPIHVNFASLCSLYSDCVVPPSRGLRSLVWTPEASTALYYPAKVVVDLHIGRVLWRNNAHHLKRQIYISGSFEIWASRDKFRCWLRKVSYRHCCFRFEGLLKWHAVFQLNNELIYERIKYKNAFYTIRNQAGLINRTSHIIWLYVKFFKM